MLTKEDFIKFIVEGSKNSVSQKKDKSEESALPEGFDSFGFDGEETEDTATETASFARNLMEASGFGNAQYLERSEVILGDDPAAKYLPDQVYYWPQLNDRPYQTLLFELGSAGSELLKTPLFRTLKGQQILEDALSRLVQMSLKGFEQGGEKRTASVKQGRQTETLCIVSCPDDREETDSTVHLVCFGTVSVDQNSLESFHIREESKYWEPQIRDDHLEKLYKRHFSKLASDRWQNAFISGEERKLARKLLEVCIEKSVNEKQIQQSAVELLEEIAKSFGLRRKGGKKGRRLTAFELPSDHDIGMDSEEIEKHGGKNPFSGMTLRDEKNRLLGYIIYCLDEKKDAVELQNYLKANNRFHNVLIIYPDGDHAELELSQGKVPLAGKLTKKGAAYQGEGEVVNLLSRFFVVSKAKVKNPTELAQELAYRARYLRRLAIRELAEEDGEGPLRKLYNAFKESLVHDQTEEEFADAFAQTLTYGLLTARWMGSEQLTKNGDRFTRQNALKYLPTTSNFLGELFESALSLKLDEHRGRLIWLVDDIANLLDRIDVNYVFGVGDKGFGEETDPVIHFYEPFLSEYDKKLKNKRGVFFTPRPVVSFIVRCVHEILQKEFGLEDGLASTDTWGDVQKSLPSIELPEGVRETDPFITILDPATGTGTFIYECIELIEKTMKDKWSNEFNTSWDSDHVIKRWQNYVSGHLLNRLYGYELMMASYSIAHLKIAFKLGKTGYKLNSSDRLHIYLTNTLASPFEEHENLPGMIPALALEAREVNNVKINIKFSVVIGNPPYMGESSNISKDKDGNLTFIGKLLKPYFLYDNKSLNEKNTKWLHDDYVKFTRYAQSRIDDTGIGVFSFITNNSYLDSPTFRGMRQQLQNSFSNISLLDLHGNTKRSAKSPDGKADVNVFDIQQGVAICIMRKFGNSKMCKVSHKDLWGDRQYKHLELNSLSVVNKAFSTINPISPFNLFLPVNKKMEEEFNRGTPITEIFNVFSVGIVTARDALTIQWTRDKLWNVVNDFALLPEEVARKKYKLSKDVRDWKVAYAQRDLKESGLKESLIKTISYRPYDKRYTYYTGKSRGFLCRPRPKVMHHMISGPNIGLITTRQQSQQGVSWRLVGVSDSIIEGCTISNKTREINYLFPLILYPSNSTLFKEEKPTSNFNSKYIKKIIKHLRGKWTDELLENSDQLIGPKNIFNFIFAQLNSQIYRSRFEDILQRQFPNIFTPSSYKIFDLLDKIGEKLIKLILLDDKDKWLNEKISNKLSKFSFINKSQKHVEKSFPKYIDNKIYLNKEAYFSNIPEDVWLFQIGAYQVCQKWLKDRKDRNLTKDDIEHYQKMIVAISETIRLQTEIDKVIDEHGGWPAAFVTDKGGPA